MWDGIWRGSFIKPDKQLCLCLTESCIQHGSMPVDGAKLPLSIAVSKTIVALRCLDGIDEVVIAVGTVEGGVARLDAAAVFKVAKLNRSPHIGDDVHALIVCKQMAKEVVVVAVSLTVCKLTVVNISLVGVEKGSAVPAIFAGGMDTFFADIAIFKGTGCNLTCFDVKKSGETLFACDLTVLKMTSGQAGMR